MATDVGVKRSETMRGLLTYRPWRGELGSTWRGVWAITRQSLSMMFRRKMFWGLYALGLLMFFMFFFGQYMLFWAQSQASQNSLRVFGKRTTPGELIEVFREKLELNGSGLTYRSFIFYQGYVVMMILAFAGSIIIGNDVNHRSLPYYLSKPISVWHYLIGKGLAVSVLVNLMTTLPALVLYFQYGFLDSYNYFSNSWRLFFGILAYGGLMTIVLTLILLATAVRMKKTVPLVLTWTTLFFFLRRLTRALVVRFNFDPRWRLIDVWNDLFLIGSRTLGISHSTMKRQPAPWEAGLVLGVVCALCLLYLFKRIRAVEVIR